MIARLVGTRWRDLRGQARHQFSRLEYNVGSAVGDSPLHGCGIELREQGVVAR